MEKKKDLRIIKTQKVIYDALISLLETKPFEEIKVSDICEKALINRSTFYSHFSDKYELLSNYINDLKDTLSKELDKNNSITNSKDYYMNMLKLFLDHVEENKNIYTSIMINNKNSIIMDMIYDAFTEDIIKHLNELNKDTKNTVPNEITSKFYIGAVFNIGIEYLKNNKYSKNQILNYLDKLMPINPIK